MGLLKIYDDTKEGKQAESKDLIIGILTAMVKQNVSSCSSLMRVIFLNQKGLTPQEVCDALGTDAVAILTAGQTLAQAVNGLRPRTLSLDPPGEVQFTANEDGTVTISQR